MAHIAVRGFVLREQPYGETDKLLDLLTADHGLITASARGSRRPKSRLLSSSQLFSLSDYQLFQNRDRYSIDSADLIESFQGLHRDIEKLVCAAHLAEVFSDLLRDNMPDRMPYELWAYTANRLDKGDDPLLIIHAAQLRLLAIEGLKPLVDSCKSCQQKLDDNVKFSFAESASYCGEKRCQSAVKGASMRLSSGTAACISHIINSRLPQLFSFSLSADVRQDVITFSERFLTEQMEKKYNRLDMLKGL
jgi:DNA repair protein RecO (recombination protein O)